MRKSYLSFFAKAVSLFGVAFILGQNCNHRHDDSGLGNLTGIASLNEDFIPKPETKTVSVIYSKQMLHNMVSCTGIRKPSVTTKSVCNEKKGTVSEYGYATTLTSPMLMSIASCAGEVCNDLLNIERPMQQNLRRVFNSVDFSSPAGNLTDAQIADVTRRLARSCWQRNESEQEKDLIISEVKATSVNAANTNSSMLMLCTSILSSLDAIKM